MMEEFTKFRTAITPFLPTYKVIEVKAVADLDTGALLSMVACLSPDDPKPSEVIEPIQGLAFIREALLKSDLYRLLDGWEKGVITIGQYKLSTPQFSSTHFRSSLSPNEDLVLGWPEFRTYRQFLLQSYGAQDLESIVRPKEVHAIARILGFNSFSELSLHRVQFKVGTTYTTRLELFAPVFAAIEPKTETSEVQFNIRIHRALQLDSLALSHRIQDHRGNRVAGGSIPLNEFQQTTSGYFTVLTSSMTLPPTSASGELHLYYKLYKEDEPIASAHFTVPLIADITNPRWDLVLTLIGNTRVWTKFGVEPEETVRQWLGLTELRPNQQEFERGVAVLLFAAQLRFLSIGQAEGVDQVVLVDEPEQIAVLVSCTTSPDVGKKISSLSMQRNRVKDKLPNHSVNATIIAPVEEGDLKPGDIEDCSAGSINLVLRPDIQVLFDQARGSNWTQSRDMFIQTLVRSPRP